MARLVAGERRRRPLLVTSFDPARAPDRARARARVPVGLLTWTRFPLRKAIPAAVHLGADVVAPHVGSFPLGPHAGRAGIERDGARSIRVAHEAGLQVVAWCPQPDEEDAFVRAGVDCLVVDDAPAALARRS